MAFQAAPATTAVSPQKTTQLIPRPVIPAPLFAGQVAKPTYGYAS